MSVFTQFTGGTPIGSIIALPQIGPTLSLQGQEWLRSGVAFSKTTYPLLSAIERFQISGVATATYTGSTRGTTAFIGSVGVTGTAGGWLRSADSGVTWTENASGSGGLPAGFVSLSAGASATRFMLFGYDGSTDSTLPLIYHSTNGTTWTLGWTGLTSQISNNARTQSAWTGTNVIFAQYNNAGSELFSYRTTDGVTVTRSSIGTGVSLDPICMRTNGSGSVVITGTNSASSGGWYTTDHGVTWLSSSVLSASGVSNPAASGFQNGKFIMCRGTATVRVIPSLASITTFTDLTLVGVPTPNSSVVVGGELLIICSDGRIVRLPSGEASLVYGGQVIMTSVVESPPCAVSSTKFVTFNTSSSPRQIFIADKSVHDSVGLVSGPALASGSNYVAHVRGA